MRGRVATREKATIAGRVRTWSRFQQWLRASPRFTAPSPAAVRQYVVGLLRRGRQPSYVLGQLSNLTVGLRLLTPGDLTGQTDLADARDALKRLLPFHRVRQARPATAQEVSRLERRDPHHLGLLVRLLWHAAARFSDWVGRLPARSVQLLPRRWVLVTYVRTKTSHRGIQRMATFRLPAATWQALHRRLRRLLPHQAVFTTPYPLFRRWLLAHSPGLSSHSFRRGAIQRMLDAGVRPREITRLTGHQRLSTMFGYAARLPPTARREMARAASALGA